VAVECETLAKHKVAGSTPVTRSQEVHHLRPPSLLSE